MTRREHGAGRFITLEGIEGSGKSTQVARLAERLRSRGERVVVTREPGGTELGRQLRSVLLRTDAGPISPVAELLLYVADRAQHLAEVIEPALAEGALVLCDRYADATAAYQGYGRQIGLEAVLALHRSPPLDRRPDRTILLDFDPDQSLARARSRNRATAIDRSEGRFEQERMAFHRRVRQGYLELAARDPDRIRTVDAAGTPEDVAKRIEHALADLLPLAGERR